MATVDGFVDQRNQRRHSRTLRTCCLAIVIKLQYPAGTKIFDIQAWANGENIPNMSLGTVNVVVPLFRLFQAEYPSELRGHESLPRGLNRSIHAALPDPAFVWGRGACWHFAPAGHP